MEEAIPKVVLRVCAAVMLTGLFVLLIFVRDDETDGSDCRVIRYGRRLRVLTWFLWLFCIGLSAVAWHARDDQHAIAIAVVGGFFLLTLVMHLEVFGIRIQIDQQGLTTRSPWRRSRHIPWGAIERVWFSEVLQWYVIETAGQGRIRLHVYLNGAETVLTELESRGVPIEER